MNGGLVGIIANDSARYSIFSSCVTSMIELLPQTEAAGAHVEWLIGGDWCEARNSLARQTVEEERDWLWFMDDDHAFPPGLVTLLLRHNLPLVTPVCLTRTAPFNAVSYVDVPHPQIVGAQTRIPLPLSDQPKNGLIRIAVGGCAGMLIRREVLEAIEPPWFEYGAKSEDIIFCEKAIVAGFQLYADLDARLGHITTAVVWPSVKDNQWVTGFTIGRDLNLYAPAAEHLLQQEEELSLAP